MTTKKPTYKELEREITLEKDDKKVLQVLFGFVLLIFLLIGIIHVFKDAKLQSENEDLKESCQIPQEIKGYCENDIGRLEFSFTSNHLDFNYVNTKLKEVFGEQNCGVLK